MAHVETLKTKPWRQCQWVLHHFLSWCHRLISSGCWWGVGWSDWCFYCQATKGHVWRYAFHCGKSCFEDGPVVYPANGFDSRLRGDSVLLGSSPTNYFRPVIIFLYLLILFHTLLRLTPFFLSRQKKSLSLLVCLRVTRSHSFISTPTGDNFRGTLVPQLQGFSNARGGGVVFKFTVFELHGVLSGWICLSWPTKFSSRFHLCRFWTTQLATVLWKIRILSFWTLAPIYFSVPSMRASLSLFALSMTQGESSLSNIFERKFAVSQLQRAKVKKSRHTI